MKAIIPGKHIGRKCVGARVPVNDAGMFRVAGEAVFVIFEEILFYFVYYPYILEKLEAMEKITVKQNFLSRLKNTEHFDLMEAITSGVEFSTIVFPLIAAPWNKLTACFLTEKKYYTYSHKQEATLLIEKAETIRIKSVRRIRQAIVLQQDSKDPEVQNAVRLLLNLAHLYKDATYSSYTENSALITNFLKDLASGNYKDAACLLRLMPLIDEATENNEIFKEIYRQRTTGIHSLVKGYLKKARRETDRSLAVFANLVNSLYDVCKEEASSPEKTEELGGICRIINSFLSNAETIYARRVPSYHSKDISPDAPLSGGSE